MYMINELPTLLIIPLTQRYIKKIMIPAVTIALII